MLLGVNYSTGAVFNATPALGVGGGGVVSREKGARSMGEEKKEGKNNNNKAEGEPSLSPSARVRLPLLLRWKLKSSRGNQHFRNLHL